MSARTPLSVSVLYNKSNTFGLSDDVQVLERLFKRLSDELDQPILKPHYLDFREPLYDVDIQIHLEIPIYGAIPWARINMILVNSEWWVEAYDSYLHSFDSILFRDPHSMEKFKQRISTGPHTEAISRMVCLPWCGSCVVKQINPNDAGTIDGFVSLLGASENKYQAMKVLISKWKDEYPPLRVYTARKGYYESLNELAPSQVSVIQADLTSTERNQLITKHRGNLVCSMDEGYGYAAAHAEVAGAFTIMNRLPVFTYYYDNQEGVGWLSNPLDDHLLSSELDAAIQAYRSSDKERVRTSRQSSADKRFRMLLTTIGPLFLRMMLLLQNRKPKGPHHLPPILHLENCPPITVITPTYNRRKLLDIAFNNILGTDYPKKKIQWIVIEDHEDSTQMATDKVIRFQQMCPEVDIKYIPIQGRMSIGQKRNLAVDQADHEIVLFMDDDDHYPPTSFRRRVAWLLHGEKQGQHGFARIACCTTIALYDLMTGVSAVNVPPIDLPLCQRISEATLTFYKSVWTERPFTEVSIAEGEEWIRGREKDVLEMPPQHIIVAFSHQQNQSSRRIPPRNQPPSCFWGFSPDYLRFIHGLVGIEIEEDHSIPSRKSHKK